ncbi:unnamed protein product [Chrysoparadoxa australica]
MSLFRTWKPYIKHYSRLTRRVVRYGGGTLLISSAGAALYYRPLPSDPKLLEGEWEITSKLKAKARLTEASDEPEAPLLSVARCFIFGTIATMSKVLLEYLNETSVHDDQHHKYLVSRVLYRHRGQPLLTVSNHASTLDDPTLFSALMPLKYAIRPKFMRWTVCSEEICFENAAVSSFFGAGKVLPIARGAGIQQLLLMDYTRRLVSGEWCHLFPEGRTVQTGKVGARGGTRGKAIGSLKWGVGKVVAHSPPDLEIIPFFHSGMQNVVPEHPVSKECTGWLPALGKSVHVRVGPAVLVRDLIEAHEKTHGKLFVVSPCARGKGKKDPNLWSTPPTKSEQELYSAITRRIQEALERLEALEREEQGEAYPTAPDDVLQGKYEGADPENLILPQ